MNCINGKALHRLSATGGLERNLDWVRERQQHIRSSQSMVFTIMFIMSHASWPIWYRMTPGNVMNVWRDDWLRWLVKTLLGDPKLCSPGFEYFSDSLLLNTSAHRLYPDHSQYPPLPRVPRSRLKTACPTNPAHYSILVPILTDYSHISHAYRFSFVSSLCMSKDF